MALPSKTIESMEQIAEKLEKWANNKKRHRMLCSGLAGLGCRSNLSEPLRGFGTILLKLKCWRPEAAKEVEKEHRRLLSLAKIIDKKIKDGQRDLVFPASALQVSANLLAKKLRIIAKTAREEALPGEPGKTKEHTISDDSVQIYVELNLAERLLTIGTEKYRISSEQVWNFLGTLVHNSRTRRITPRFDNSHNWKNAVDTLRRQISKKRLYHVIYSSRDGYFLAGAVNLKYGSQIGIRKTRLRRRKRD